MVDNLVAFLHAEVDVEVGHRDTFRVEETFEQQVKLKRIEVGDFQRIGHQRSGTRTTARPYRYAVILRPLDKLHYDQEVAGEPHLVDNLKFNIQTFVIFRALFGANGRIREEKLQTLFQTFFRFQDQEVFGGHVAGRELRQKILAQANGDVAAFSNLYAVLQRFRDIGKQLAHLLFAAHVLLRRIVTRAFRIVEGKPIVDGDANFMGVKVVGIDKAHIVGCHHWQSMLFCQRHRGVQITLFIRTAGADQLQVEAIREIFFIKIDTLLHQRAIAAQQAAANIAHTPAGD